LTTFEKFIVLNSKRGEDPGRMEANLLIRLRARREVYFVSAFQEITES
jgi:hypothetical protein